jgi:aerobic-type carbon monoxide dehydrogenase small subunit (CoxS/CutS family)
MSIVKLRVNGTAHEVEVDPSTPLLYVLRNDLDLQGPRFGCGLGQCGVCTVIVNGAAVRSCITPISNVRGEVTTLEGLAKNGKLHPLQQAWIEEQAAQCGYCQNGKIMTAKRPTLCFQAARWAGRSGQGGGARIRRLCREPQPSRL